MAKETQTPPSPRRIHEISWGYASPFILQAALQVKLFDLLERGGLTLVELCEKTRSSARGMAAILEALVGLELLVKKGERYQLTPESETFLVTTKPSFQGGFLLHFSEQILPQWLKLPEAMRTGKPIQVVNQEKEGAKFFEELVERLFPVNYAAACHVAQEILKHEEASFIRVLDLASGSAVWSVPFAQQSEKVKVTAFDWPTVLPIAQKITKRFGLAERYHFMPGDLRRDDFGKGYHVVLLGHILHGEGEKHSRKLLQKVYQCLAPGGTAIIAEFVPNDERTGPLIPLLFGVNMLLHTEEGEVFTFPQMKSWLKDLGFEKIRTLDAPAVSPLLLATKPVS